MKQHEHGGGMLNRGLYNGLCAAGVSDENAQRIAGEAAKYDFYFTALDKSINTLRSDTDKSINALRSDMEKSILEVQGDVKHLEAKVTLTTGLLLGLNLVTLGVVLTGIIGLA